MRVRRFNDEVLFTEDPIVTLGPEEMQVLKERARENPRQRIRLCAHRDTSDRLHEMFIVHGKDAYVRPHKHLNKIESAHVIEGLVDLIIFDADGGIAEVMSMGDYASGRAFYHRIDEPSFHTLLIRSEVLVFHEVTNGPFQEADNVLAPWSPDESDSEAVNDYLHLLNRSVEEFLGRRSGSET